MLDPQFPSLRRSFTYCLDLLFAPTCLSCQKSIDQPHHLCADCFQKLPKQPENYCLRCGTWTVGVQDGCGYCLNIPDITADACYFAYAYEGCIAQWIIGLKFSDHPEWATLLARLFWHSLQESLTWEAPDMVMPIPLHPYRLIQRRYNQSALLAGSLANFLHRPLVTNGLKRVKITQPQSRLSAEKRIENVRGAFQCSKNQVFGRSILLVDDVFTTGSTTRAAVQTLKKAGARRVIVACLAAAQPH